MAQTRAGVALSRTSAALKGADIPQEGYDVALKFTVPLASGSTGCAQSCASGETIVPVDTNTVNYKSDIP